MRGGGSWLRGALLAVAVAILALPTLPARAGIHEMFVANVFQDLLDRPPTSGESTGFVNFLANGGSRYNLAFAVDTSTEYRQRLVTGYLNTFLQRAPGSAELTNVVSLLVNGQSQEQVISIIVGTAEYRTANGVGSNAELVEQLFNDLLNRPADPTGLDALTDLLDNGATAAFVALAMLNSTEYRNNLVTGFFEDFLGRPPGTPELTAFLNPFTTDEDIIARILASEEYLAKAVVQVPSPGSLLLLSSGLVFLPWLRRRRSGA